MADKQNGLSSIKRPSNETTVFQDLPPSKYPRSYSENYENRLATSGSQGDHGSPGSVPGPKNLPSVGYINTYGDNVQAGELSAVEAKRPISFPHVPNWGDLQEKKKNKQKEY